MCVMTDAPKGWVFVRSPDDSIRYVLGETGIRMVGFVGINPSTARPDELDQTLKRVSSFARSWNYDGWVMFNVYPVRMTIFEQLEETERDQLRQENLSQIRTILDGHPIGSICCAWGDLIVKRPYLPDCLRAIAPILVERGLPIVQIGPVLTGRGHPRHPLYANGTLGKFSFDLDSYLASLPQPT